MSGNLVVPDMVRARMLRSFDPVGIAEKLEILLDEGDTTAATALWREWRERAARKLADHPASIAPQVQAEALRGLSEAVRAEIIRLRGSALAGAENRTKPPARPVAQVLAFPTRTAPLPVPRRIAGEWTGPEDRAARDEWTDRKFAEMIDGWI